MRTKEIIELSASDCKLIELALSITSSSGQLTSSTREDILNLQKKMLEVKPSQIIMM